MHTPYLAHVARTAYGIARARTFTDIPYSQQVFDSLTKILTENGEWVDEPADLPMVPLYEARYLLADRLLQENGVDQVLEVAAGLSLRLWLMVLPSSYPKYRCVEIDQPIMVALKKKILGDIMFPSEEISRGNFNGWYLEAGDALNRRSLTKACEHFREKHPIAVINEGLAVYFDHKEKAQYGENVRHLLGRFGGLWITPDIMIEDAFSNIPEWLEIKKAWYARINKNLDGYNFRNVTEAQKFYDRLGLSVEVHWLTEVIDELVSPERIGLSREIVRGMLSRWPLFVMRPR